MKTKVKVLSTLLKPVATVKDMVERLAKTGTPWIVLPELDAEKATGKRVVVAAVIGVMRRSLSKKVKRKRREKVKTTKKAKANVKENHVERKRRSKSQKKRKDSLMKTILLSSKRRTRTCRLLRVENMKKLKTRTALRSSVSRSKRLQVSTTISLEEIPTR